MLKVKMSLISFQFPNDDSMQAIEQLSPEKLKEYREIFSFFDRDGGGSIGAEEFEDWINILSGVLFLQSLRLTVD